MTNMIKYLTLITFFAALTAITAKDDCCQSTTSSCPSGLFSIDIAEEDAGVVCCEVEDATVNWGVDPVPQCGTDASGVSTTASGGASNCCTTTESTCPEGKMNVNADTVIAGVKVETCCDPSSDGSQAEITNLDFDTLDACTASASTGNTGSTPSSAPSAAPKERVAVAIGMAILGAVLQ